MVRSRSAENSLDPAAGKTLFALIIYRGPIQDRGQKLIDGQLTVLKRVPRTLEADDSHPWVRYRQKS